MTAISAIISRYGTIHVTDSLRTSGGRPKEFKKTKIVRVEHFRGAFSFWGLAKNERGWNTINLLKERASEAKKFESPEELTIDLQKRLNKFISKGIISNEQKSGIGIHFTVYEHIKDYWIPEMFLISNFANTNYDSVYDDGFHFSRETFGTAMSVLMGVHVPSELAHRKDNCRLFVHEHLQGGGFLIYNNGDPLLFNIVASDVFKMTQRLYIRNSLIEFNNIEAFRDIARVTLEIISKIQGKFALKGTQKIGGIIHDLSITHDGKYESGSGD